MQMSVSPIDQRHRALGAKMTPFGGWEMPLSYPDGTLDEHRACRSSAVVFDVSHLGTLRVTGSGAFGALQRAFTNDLTRIEPGRAQYTHLLDDEDGSVLDDIIIWWVEPERFDVMPNASNTSRVAAALEGAEGVHTHDVTSERAVLAVQGPEAAERLATVFAEAAEVGRFRVVKADWRGVECVVAGTGYTGESGVEIAVPPETTGELWEELLAAGIKPAGLGARDTLRLEAGLPLHGQELGPGITPLQAGLGWVVRWDKGPFRGRDVLQVERDSGPARLLRGLNVEGRRPPRTGQEVLIGDEVLGEVTSGNFSPVLGHGIAMAFLPTSIEPGAVVTVRARNDELAAEVVALPFLTS
ncbi:MAG: glycine cleavage system aminomethyltransferase GcvT [Acidimicrobiales bacterium]